VLRSLRRTAGLSQEELAARAGLSAKAIGALERGERTHPRPHTLRALADALGLAGSDRLAFLSGTGDPAGPDGAGLDIARALLESLSVDPLADSGPLPPGSRMPLTRNPLFVGRRPDLRAIAASLWSGRADAGGQVIAATGMAGLGKTQLLSEFVHRYGRYFAGGVFWLSFASPAEVPLEVAACGGRGYLGLRDDFASLSLEDRVTLVRAAWRDAVPRLLVFDNCEDEELLVEWRPPSGGCRVLLTSRRADWDPALGVQSLRLETLPRPESVALLRRFRPDLPAGETGLHDVAAEVGDLPLALHLAGSFLHRYRAELGPSEYLAELRRPGAVAHVSLRGQGLAAELSPTRHVQSVAQTFAMSHASLDCSDEIDRRARALLAGSAWLAPGEPIPRDVLLGSGEERRWLADALARLDALGLVDAPAEDVRLHRLVVDFVNGLAPDDGARQAVEARFAEAGRQASEGALPTAQLPSVVTHLIHLARSTGERADRRAAAIWHALGRAQHAAADFAAARHALEQALAIRGAVLGPDDPDTAACLTDLGMVLIDEGRAAEAQGRLEAALAIRERALGPEHPDTAATLHGLGLALQAQADLPAGRLRLERAFAVRERTLGADHPLTATTLTRLAFLIREQGDVDLARSLMERTLAICERTLGPEHPDTAASLNVLGLVTRDRGDFETARALLERAVAIRRRTLGPNHPETATSVNNLGGVVRALGDAEAALELFEQALRIRERVLGPDHPLTAQSINNVAGPLQDQGRLEAAQRLFERALAIRERVLGADHPDTGSSLNNLARLLMEQGELAAAQPLQERAVAVFERSLAPDHPTTAIAVFNLARVLAARGEAEAARPLFERCVAIFERSLGRDHPRAEQARRELAGLRPGR
jgi:tetratricopeptide (TPR) repeat protein/transcriptional regulator with XRE-family HTH domain